MYIILYLLGYLVTLRKKTYKIQKTTFDNNARHSVKTIVKPRVR